MGWLSLDKPVKAVQLGGACESQHPAKGAQPSQPRPEASTAPFLCPRPRLSSMKPPGAAWAAKIRKKKKKNMAQIEQKSLRLLTLSHCFLHVLGQTPGQLLFKLKALSFAPIVNFVLLAFPCNAQIWRSKGHRGFQVYIARMQVLPPRAINTTMAVLEGKNSLLLACFLVSYLPLREVWMLSCDQRVLQTTQPITRVVRLPPVPATVFCRAAHGAEKCFTFIPAFGWALGISLALSWLRHLLSCIKK